MLLKLTGSSCAGKSTLARAVAEALAGVVAVHDSDEIPVPGGTKGRQQAGAWWVRRALAYQAEGVDLLLTSQSPMGEVLATPSALELEGIAVCLVDVPDDLRVERLRQRGSKSWSPQLEQALLNWAVWHRGHASDPQHRPGVIVSAGWEDMAWHRWSGWSKGDSRWSTALIDTADCSVASAAEELLEWIETCRAARKEGTLPLLRGWASA